MTQTIINFLLNPWVAGTSMIIAWSAIVATEVNQNLNRWIHRALIAVCLMASIIGAAGLTQAVGLLDIYKVS